MLAWRSCKSLEFLCCEIDVYSSSLVLQLAKNSAWFKFFAIGSDEDCYLLFAAAKYVFASSYFVVVLKLAIVASCIRSLKTIGHFWATVVQSWFSSNPSLKFKPLFWFVYFNVSLHFKTWEIEYFSWSRQDLWKIVSCLQKALGKFPLCFELTQD